jgi:YebC/PmpR family DNA-binding regulatory protein
MSGHSKWSQIKRQKGVADARRGQLFTKLTREIIVAARQGGSDPEGNPQLRLAVQRARDYNMPVENIERAIKRASGQIEGAALTEIIFEGYAPGGAAILIRALTDNRNRTLAEVRNTFTRGGGTLGEAGSVSWLFESKGVLTVEADEVNAEELALAAIDAGADDVKIEGGSVEIYTKPEDLETVRKALEPHFTISSAELSLVPSTAIKLDDKAALQALKLLDKLEVLDEVQHVFTNADFPNNVVQEYRS